MGFIRTEDASVCSWRIGLRARAHSRRSDGGQAADLRAEEPQRSRAGFAPCGWRRSPTTRRTAPAVATASGEVRPCRGGVASPDAR